MDPSEGVPVIEELRDGVSRTFRCSSCGRTAARFAQLLRHAKIHTGAKPHWCNFCQKGFGRRDNLLRHLRSTHSVQVENTHAKGQQETFAAHPYSGINLDLAIRTVQPISKQPRHVSQTRTTPKHSHSQDENIPPPIVASEANYLDMSAAAHGSSHLPLAAHETSLQLDPYITAPLDVGTTSATVTASMYSNAGPVPAYVAQTSYQTLASQFAQRGLYPGTYLAAHPTATDSPHLIPLAAEATSYPSTLSHLTWVPNQHTYPIHQFSYPQYHTAAKFPLISHTAVTYSPSGLAPTELQCEHQQFSYETQLRSASGSGAGSTGLSGKEVADLRLPPLHMDEPHTVA
ncbi:hypothetical protein M427DRAFT_61658 [Gonapodya prolifera JEL478]|uniref:C2H2-type domain-containing protein n=1 Tax=Gonapodya prolifera (strain JEL478) TaxID=1344416 RepID=A0A139A1T8_GONPJ|nr:hypothetical protein M427DRAFT_61658 [Gonapodya prolifera JEL478]|eukprot:KXS10711.1 hypothetical protein M427DRAFT_61658 [Gonapodya prolifera JEL478]